MVLPTFQRESRATLRRPRRSSPRDTDPLVTQLRPGRARAVARRCSDLERARPGPARLFTDLDPLITASRTGFPAAQRLLDDLEPLLRADRPGRCSQLIPILRLPRALQARADGVLRQHRRRPRRRPTSAGDRRGALPAHDEPAQRREPRRLSAAGRLQPAEPVRAARAPSTSSRTRPRGLRGPPLRPRRARRAESRSAGAPTPCLRRLLAARAERPARRHQAATTVSTAARPTNEFARQRPAPARASLQEQQPTPPGRDDAVPARRRPATVTTLADA